MGYKTLFIGTSLLLSLAACSKNDKDHGGPPPPPPPPAEFTVSAMANTGGSISPVSTMVKDGNTTTLTVTVDSGYRIDSVSGCGGSLSGTAFTTAAITADCTVSALFSLIPIASELNFDVEGGSNTARLSWDHIGSSEYNLYISSAPNCDVNNYTACPDGQMISNISSPYVPDGLVNGNAYYFTLEAKGENGSADTYAEFGFRPLEYTFSFGRVNDIEFADDGTQYLAGDFYGVGPLTGSAVAYSIANDFRMTPNFPVLLPEVTAITSDNNGGWYIAGDIYRLDGEDEQVDDGILVHVLSDGSIETDFNAPIPDYDVEKLLVKDNKIYLLIDGDIFVTNTDGTDEGQFLTATPEGSIEDFAINDNALYLAGRFNSIEGEDRNGLAAISFEGDLLPWNPLAFGAAYQVGVIDENIVVFAESEDEQGDNRHEFVAIINASGDITELDIGDEYNIQGITLGNELVYVGVEGEDETTLEEMFYIDAYTPEGEKTDFNFFSLYQTSDLEADEMVAAGDYLFIWGIYNDPGIDPNDVENLTGEEYLFAIGLQGEIKQLPINGYSYPETFASDGRTLYIGGEFISSDITFQRGLVAIDSDGIFDKNWRPQLTGSVRDLVIADDVIYAAGQFFEGQVITENKLKVENSYYSHSLKAENSNLAMAAFNAQGDVIFIVEVEDEMRGSAVAVKEGAIYLGGIFDSVNGISRSNLAAFDTSGTLLPWNPVTNEEVHSLVFDGDTLYAGGSFSEINSESRVAIAALNLDGSLNDWDAGIQTAGAQVRDIIVNNNDIYFSGYFFNVGGNNRSHIAAVNKQSSLLDFAPNIVTTATFISVLDMELVNSNLYFGGIFSDVNSETRSSTAAFNLDGTLLDWHVSTFDGFDDVGFIYALKFHDDKFYFGGDFSQINGEDRWTYGVTDSNGEIQ